MPFASLIRTHDADKHDFDVNAVLYYKDKLYTGADDGKIKVWDEGLRLLDTIDAHSRSVITLAAGDDTLFSGSTDGTVKEWSISTMQEKGTILKIPSEIWKIWYADGTLFVGDRVGTVKLYVRGKLVSSINLKEPVKDLLVFGNLLYTIGELDLVINEVYEGDKPRFGLRKIVMGRLPVCVAGDKVCFCSRSGTDILIHENSVDLQFKNFAEAYDAHEVMVTSMCGLKNGDNTFLYSGGWDKVIKQWKITEKCVHKVTTCKVDLSVNVLALGPPGKLYIGSHEGHVMRVDI